LCKVGFVFSVSIHRRVTQLTQLSLSLKTTCFFMVFIFECRPRMFQFLSDLEETAVKLDRMTKGSSISSVAGSSVGIAGGVMSIIGLGLAPFTAGLSLGLTMTGLGLGVTTCPVLKLKGPNVAFTAGNVAYKPITVVKKIRSLRANSSAVKVLRSEEVARKAVSVGLQEANAGRKIPKLAANLPDIKKLAKRTPLALSKTARAGFVGLNVLFIGLDIYSICSESKSLAKGEQCRMSQLIRSRSSLWRTEINNWDRMYGCLCKGKYTFRENLCILDQPLNNV
uniref:Si:ch73-233k15.2 n=1 Tax=Astyanax mexicanus TaxID=7994 RepID=A0A8B9GTR0_ASTMX